MSGLFIWFAPLQTTVGFGGVGLYYLSVCGDRILRETQVFPFQNVEIEQAWQLPRTG